MSKFFTDDHSSIPTWTVYILKCNDGTYYTGCSSKPDQRLRQHEQGQVNFTKSRLPVKRVTQIIFIDKYKAFKFEKYLKSGSGKAFMFKRLV